MRLIDADALMKKLGITNMDCNECQWGTRYENICCCCSRGGDFEDACIAIENAPTIEQSQWIPVSERLPEELEEVNITWTNTNPEPYYDFIKDKPATGSAVYYKGRWYWYSAVCTDYLREYGCSPYDEMDDAIKVLAWMPLPKAYKVTK